MEALSGECNTVEESFKENILRPSLRDGGNYVNSAQDALLLY